MSASEKTAGQVAIEAWRECDGQFNARMTYVVAAVIAHVRPQIEAEARAAAIEEAIAAIRKRAECTLSDALEVADAADAISALSTLPPAHVCVPVDAPVVAKPLLFEERSGEWLDASFGFHIALDATGPNLFYTASLGEGDPADFGTLAEAKEWCQNEADNFMKLNAMLAARPK